MPARFGVREQQEARLCDRSEDGIGNILGRNTGLLHPAPDPLGIAVIRRAHAVGQARLDKCRAQHRHRHPGSRQFRAQHLGKPDHGSLGRAVRGDSRRTGQAGPGSDIDDMPAPAPTKVADKVMTAAHHSHQIDLEHPLPVFQRRLAEHATGGHACIVDQHMETAIKPLDQRLDLAPVVIAGHVQQFRHMPFAGQAISDLPGAPGLLVSHDDTPAGSGKTLAHGGTQAGAGAGNQCGFSGCAHCGCLAKISVQAYLMRARLRPR